MEVAMRCLLCSSLQQAFEARRQDYIEASLLASRSFSSKFAAYMNVEMERALNELEDHRSVCLSNANKLQPLAAVVPIRRQPSQFTPAATNP
jgi:hypothetical protein